MKFSIATITLLFATAHTAHSWSLPPNVAKGCATAAACATLVAGPMAAHANDATAFKVDLNTPYIIDLVRTDEARQSTWDRANFLLDSAKNFVGPAVSTELPSDIKGVVQQALSGAATVQLNGQDVAVKVVQSQAGAITIQLSNPLLPALPFRGLPSTPALVNQAADAVAEASPAAVDFALKVVKAEAGLPDLNGFWERPLNAETIRIDIDAVDLHRALSPKDIVGGGSLALGGVYATSYAFYVISNEQDAKQAAAKRADAAAKRAKAAVKKAKKAEKEAVSV